MPVQNKWVICEYRSKRWLCYSGHCVLELRPRFERLVHWYLNNQSITLDYQHIALLQQLEYQSRPSDVYHVLLGYAFANGYTE
jgi:hypothetical protein